MCGIAGLWQLAGSRDLAAQSRAMTKAIAARGPDGEGHWTDAAAGITLGHRRLAIIDLSPTGFQPMTSADGRIVITYNGELYNRAEMAAELDRPWRGTSDTEVLVATIARSGRGRLLSALSLRAGATDDFSRGRKARARSPPRGQRGQCRSPVLLGRGRRRTARSAGMRSSC